LRFNVIVTAIGGENSEGGAARFDADVLAYHPSVVTIDYALNDLQVGLVRSNTAWSSMIEKALAAKVKVILLTPTPTLGLDFSNPQEPLNQQAEQVRKLAGQYHVGLVDSLDAFRKATVNGTTLVSLMAQGNHPNGQGHALVGAALLDWFP
jgi:acyl-CoA thioesterase-1